MKRLIILFTLMASSLMIEGAQANPFKSQYVCIPPIQPNRAFLEFRIRDGGSCVKGEKWMQVFSEEDGTLFLFPSKVPLRPDQEKSLKDFKKFHGIER